MPKPGDNLSTLFRSLGPDSASLQPAAGAGAPDAEQRWPLLKALPPRRQEAPPPLGDDERQRWSQAGAPAAEPRKPALSLPSLSTKLAQSLARMGGHKRPEAAPPAPVPLAAPAPEPRAERAAVPETRAVELSPAAEVPRPLMAALERVAAPPEPRGEPAKPGLFQPDDAAPADEPPAADSLSGLFRRLDAPEPIAAKPVPRRPSFIDRWAKR